MNDMETKELIEDLADQLTKSESGYTLAHRVLLKDLADTSFKYIRINFDTQEHIGSMCMLLKMYMMLLLYLEKNPKAFANDINSFADSVLKELK